MRFTKMHGAGNDFILINNIRQKLSHAALSALAAKLCPRRTAVGADGLMAVERARCGGDFSMRFFNADGSEGEMCGNGARCIARYGYEEGLAGETQRIETVSGLITGRRIDRTHYRVRLNDPSVIDLHRTVRLPTGEYDCAYVELGVPGLPHAVLLTPQLDLADPGALTALGAALRRAPDFPRGANVSFVKILSPHALEAVTFERGVEAFTLACGTGAGSAVTALALRGLIPAQDTDVRMPGGTLSVRVTLDGARAHDLFLTGPAVRVYEGELAEA